MNSKIKGLFSTMLTLSMVVGMFTALPFMSNAATPPGPGDICAIVDGAGPGTDVGYANLDDAIAAVPTGGSSQTVIKLLDNITHTDQVNINDKNITFDLNGFNLVILNKISVSNYSYVDYTGAGEFRVHLTLTIHDADGPMQGALVTGNSTLILTGVEVTDNRTATGGGTSAVAFQCSYDSVGVVNGSVKATGRLSVGAFSNRSSTITINGNAEADYCSLQASMNSEIIINGNVISGDWGAYAAEESTVTINGTITSVPAHYVNFGTPTRTIDEFESITTKLGYFTYADYAPYNNATIWVKGPNILFNAEQSGGVSGMVDSTEIIITFCLPVTGLTLSDITVTNSTGAVITGALTGSGTTWALAIDTVTAEGNVTVCIDSFHAFTVLTSSQTVPVYKYMAPAVYTITFNANGGSVTPASANTAVDGKLTSLPTPTRSNHVFSGWFTSASGGTQITISYVFSGNTTIYAQWQPIPTATVSVTITTTVTDEVVSPPVTITMTSPPVTSVVTSPPVTNTVTNTIASPPVTNTVTSPPVTNTVTAAPMINTVTVPTTITTAVPTTITTTTEVKVCNRLNWWLIILAAIIGLGIGLLLMAVIRRRKS